MLLSGKQGQPESGGIYLYPVRYERRGAPAGRDPSERDPVQLDSLLNGKGETVF